MIALDAAAHKGAELRQIHDLVIEIAIVPSNNAGRMNVRVDEPGQHQAAGGVYHSRFWSGPGARASRIADIHDAAALHCHRGGHVMGCIGGIEGGIQYHQVGFAGRNCRRDLDQALNCNRSARPQT